MTGMPRDPGSRLARLVALNVAQTTPRLKRAGRSVLGWTCWALGLILAALLCLIGYAMLVSFFNDMLGG